jgi:hypothetical protein
MLDNRAQNPINIIRNTIGRRRIFVHVTQNPQMVYLNTDMPGNAVNVKLRKFMVDDKSVGAPFNYYQLDFGQNTIHTQTNTVFGAKATCVQVSYGNGDGENVKVPMRFMSDHIPQNFKLTIYGPGEPATLVTLDTKGAQLIFEYDYIAT